MTRNFRKYIRKFICRILIFLAVLVLYLTKKEQVAAMMTQNLKYGITP